MHFMALHKILTRSNSRAKKHQAQFFLYLMLCTIVAATSISSELPYRFNHKQRLWPRTNSAYQWTDAARHSVVPNRRANLDRASAGWRSHQLNRG
jgi:hypothetical protein